MVLQTCLGYGRTCPSAQGIDERMINVHYYYYSDTAPLLSPVVGNCSLA